MFLVDGGWSDWKNGTHCSVTCGEGVIIQQRTCTQSSPSCGGRDCLGENNTNISCNNCCPGNYINLNILMFISVISYQIKHMPGFLKLPLSGKSVAMHICLFVCVYPEAIKIHSLEMKSE